jgi:predicted alpha/beta hydrolase
MLLVVDRGTDHVSVEVHENPAADTVAVLFPAMGVPAGYYRRFAEVLREGGMAVAIADLRGTGLSHPQASRASRYGYSELADDVGAVLSGLTQVRQGKRTLLIGHSLGGQACVIHLARTQDGVDGLVLIAVGLPYWRDYRLQKLGVYGFTQGINLVSGVAGVWPGWGFGGRQARGVIRDWAYTGRHGRFPDHVIAEERLRAITVPVLAISVDDDQYTPPATMDTLMSKLESAKVRREHLTRDEAGTMIDHFKWVKAGVPLRRLILDTFPVVPVQGR